MDEQYMNYDDYQGIDAQQQCPAGTFTYTVQPGDTLFAIAQRFNTTVAAIVAVNPGLDPNVIFVGQRICIPGAVPPPGVCPPGTFAYTVVQGDTLFTLALRFGTTVAAFIAVNPGIDPNVLFVGQRICIPRVTTPPPVVCPPGTFAYTVQPGDTLFAIARRFNTTVAAILAVNPGLDPNVIFVGQRICIPSVAPPGACPPGTFAYTVQPGDTLFAIARRFNTTVAAIVAVNPGLDPNVIFVGQRICIPSVTPPGACPPGSFAYTVRPGDTLFLIARRFNTTIFAIIRLNPGIIPNRLIVGQRICIPL